MNIRFFRRSKGLMHRWYRKNFHKDWDVIEHGLDFFQEFADTIDNIYAAEQFFKDFMEQTKGCVNVDFLDTEKWDCIRKVEVDKQNGLIWFYWTKRSPLEESINQMFYGICLKFDNIRFEKYKQENFIGIIVNGYTIKEKKVKNFAKSDGWNIVNIDEKSSFFSVDIVREKNGERQKWRFMNTPISSFLIIPKQVKIHPHASEKLLYLYGLKKCWKELYDAYDKTNGYERLSKEKQQKNFRAIGHDLRIVLEKLFKLIICFHKKKLQLDTKKNYDEWGLGDMHKLSYKIYGEDLTNKFIKTTPIANSPSHDSGNPIDITDVITLVENISDFIEEFMTDIAKDFLLDLEHEDEK